MSTSGDFPSKRVDHLVFVATPQTQSLRIPVAGRSPLNATLCMPKPPQTHKSPGTGEFITIPPMPVYGVDGKAPFLARTTILVLNWVQEEWAAIEKIKLEAAHHGWNNNRKDALSAAKLTTGNLASRLDNISEATLRRSLQRLNAPTPGDIIRLARIAYGQHLLIHTRIQIQDVSARAGYSDQRHFARAFMQVTGLSPTEFRKAHEKKHAAAGRRQITVRK